MALSSNDVISPGTVVGDYRVEGHVADGGMATVYEGVHPTIGKKVAIKLMSRQLSVDSVAVERFVREARAVNQIGHPNIVDVFAFGALPDGRSYFVMEWLHGKTLADRIARHRLPDREAVLILHQVCDALEAAHEKGIMHRDLKPENVFLVSVRGNKLMVKLLDFGIAKLVGDEERGVRTTGGGMVLGTPAYISPEQARAKGVDLRTDIYSLGVMAYELFAGMLPFQSDVALDLVHMHVYEPPPPLAALRPDLPAPLVECIMGMLEKEAAKRPPLTKLNEALQLVRDRTTGQVPILSEELSGPIYLGDHHDQTPDGVPLAAPAPAEDDIPVVLGEPEVAPPRRTWLLAAVGAVVVGCAAAILLTRSPAPAAPPAASLAPAPSPPAAGNAPAAPPSPAKLVVLTDAKDARILLDGTAIGTGTARVDVGAAGTHELVVEAPHRRPYHKTVTMTAGQLAELSIHLERAPAGKARSGQANPRDVDYMVNPFERP